MSKWIKCGPTTMPKFIDERCPRVRVIAGKPGRKPQELMWTKNIYATREKNRLPRWEYPGGGIATWTPTHWQPLPEPPTEDE